MTQLSKVKQNIHQHKDKSCNLKNTKRQTQGPTGLCELFLLTVHIEEVARWQYKTVLIIFPLKPPDNHHNFRCCQMEVRGLTDWGLMALTAQIGYNVPLKSMLQLIVKLMRKMTMLHLGTHTINHYNK